MSEGERHGANDGEWASASVTIWDGLSVDELENEPSNSISASDGSKAVRAALKTDKQKRRLRTKLFRWALWTTSLVLGANVVMFILYFISQWGRVEASVMIAWISGTVVEILGIVAIMARYLFEPDKGHPSPRD